MARRGDGFTLIELIVVTMLIAILSAIALGFSADAAGYCVRSTVGGRSWHKLGPAGPITTTSCP